VRAYHTPELDERMTRGQLSDAQLMHITVESRQTDVSSAPQVQTLLELVSLAERAGVFLSGSPTPMVAPPSTAGTA
jgi:hypothetical protein